MKKYLILSILTLTVSAFASNPPFADDSAPEMTQPKQAPAPSQGSHDASEADGQDEDVIIMEEDESDSDSSSN